MEKRTQGKEPPNETDESSDSLNKKPSEESAAPVAAVASRSERKSIREKKRRSELNNALDSLASILYTIDPSMECAYMSKHETGDSPHPKKRIKSDNDTNIANRVDLINYSVNVLKRVHEENEARKLLIADLLYGTSNLRGAGLALESNASQRNNTEVGALVGNSLLRNDLARTQTVLRKNEDETLQAHLSRLTNVYGQLGTSILGKNNSLSVGQTSNVSLNPLTQFSAVPGSTPIRSTQQLPELSQLKSAAANSFPAVHGRIAPGNSLRQDSQLAIPQNAGVVPNIRETIAQQGLLDLLQSRRSQPLTNTVNAPIPSTSNTLVNPHDLANSLISSRLQTDLSTLQRLVQQRNQTEVLQREALGDSLLARVLSRRSEGNDITTNLDGGSPLLGSKRTRDAT